MMKLDRSIAVIDLETTGINPSVDKIIEIAIVKVLPDGNQQIKRKLINPEMPIDPSSTAIHGITNEMVANAPTFKQVANELRQFIENCDLAGYNSNRFDIPMLVEEFLRAGLDFDADKHRLIDVQRVFHKMEPRTLGAAYKFYCNKTLENAHSAEADARATWEILEAQLQRYPELENSIDTVLKFIGEDEVVDFARRMINKDGVVIFNFGKHKGKPVEQIFKQEPQYYDWMMKGDFALNTKQKLTELFNKFMLKK